MRELAAAITPRVVRAGPHTYRISPPPARVALVVLAALERLDESITDTDAWETLEWAAGEWLPPQMHRRYFLPEMTDQERMLCARTLRDLLCTGLPESAERKRHIQDEIALRQRSRRMGIWSVISDLCYYMGSTPQDVLGMPWPLFVAMAAELDRRRALERLAVTIGYGAARTGGDALNTLLRAAGLSFDPAYEPHPRMTPAWQQEQEEKARRIARQMAEQWKTKGGVA